VSLNILSEPFSVRMTTTRCIEDFQAKGVFVEFDVVLMHFLDVPAASDYHRTNRSGYTRIRPRIPHSVVGSLFARRREEEHTDLEG
jgi:hypothetical protein